MQVWVIFSTDTPTTAFVEWIIRLRLLSTGMLSPPCTWGIPAILLHTIIDMHKGYYFDGVPHHYQVGINCGAIDEASRSLKAIDNRVIIDFLDKNAVTALFRNKNYVFLIIWPSKWQSKLYAMRRGCQIIALAIDKGQEHGAQIRQKHPYISITSALSWF